MSRMKVSYRDLEVDSLLSSDSLEQVSKPKTILVNITLLNCNGLTWAETVEI